MNGPVNDSCPDDSSALQHYEHQTYAIIYSIILVPGLIGNVLALWVFHVYVKETKKAVIFMINLAVADLLQVLSLPLRIYYYLNNSWPFGRGLCMFCFYLKYVNMYASIFFLVCISVRRCMMVLNPLSYTTCRRRLDRSLCAAGWLFVCLCCLPFPLLRGGGSDSKCFAELPVSPVPTWAGLVLMVGAELLGFLLPFGVVGTCTWLAAGSLRDRHPRVPQDGGEKRRALRMVLSCAGVFLLCFLPYHVTFPLHWAAKSRWRSSCQFRATVLRCHPVTLCLASLNCCLDPLMYYFTTEEFRRRLSRPELPESLHLQRRMSCITTDDKALPSELGC
ncbi:probable G-protein coupled receptor 174 [Clupea harengus]|uniref:Probable G-protein coupled receptor 174 n=1 Tax=Clupea harengus TaxID=7950 RepID=A0A6P3W4Z0_CLUHA|nr:probable G-protein coupled receptor 174 [Clupea harengus]